jgi:hypothetical protein
LKQFATRQRCVIRNASPRGTASTGEVSKKNRTLRSTPLSLAKFPLYAAKIGHSVKVSFLTLLGHQDDGLARFVRLHSTTVEAD